MTIVGTSLTLWTSERGVPERLVWEGKRYWVTDTPTPLEFDLGLVTHIANIPTGWRLQGTDEVGDSVMFDIGCFAEDRGWHVLHTYR
jgi:hypothetical protein